MASPEWNFRAWAYILGCLFFALVIGLPTAHATHKNDHRFTVSGFVRDGNGQPLQDMKVVATDKQTQVGATGFTDSDGRYEILLHLHDQNAGDEIRVVAGKEIKTVQADFDPEDVKTPRRVQVDFGSPPRESSGGSLNLWAASVVVAVLVCAFLYWRGYSRKKVPAQPKPWQQRKKSK